MAKKDSVLVLRRIRLTYHLRLSGRDVEIARRVHALHGDHCPVARTLTPCVAVETRLVLGQR